MDSMAGRMHSNAGLVPSSKKGFWWTYVNTVACKPENSKISAAEN